MRSNRRLKVRVAQIAFIVAVALGLEVSVRTGAVSPLLISPPSDMAIRLFKDLRTEELWIALGTTVAEIGVSLTLCLLIGMALGYVFYRMQLFHEAVEPVLVAFYSAPAMLLYPFVMVFLNEGSGTAIAMAVIMGSAPIAINVALGFAGIERIWSRVGVSLCATPRQMLFKIMIPAAVPTIVTGFRIGLTFAMVTVISLEFLTYSGGLGRLISWRYYTFDTNGVYSSILLVMIIAVLINTGVSTFEARVRSRWD